MKQMPVRLFTTVSKIASLANSTNAALISEFYRYMKNNGASESHTNNSLKANMAFAQFLGLDATFYDVKTKEQINAFLDTKIKSVQEHHDKKWITTWNDYLNDIKYFLDGYIITKTKQKTNTKKMGEMASSDWQTPTFASIKKKKTKRLSPYLGTELWERDELLFIIKYEPFKRNKTALSLFWDLMQEVMK
jgi:integrase/recombinase XerD